MMSVVRLRNSKRRQQPSRILLNKRMSEHPKLLSGGNPQIPKGDGEAPVQAYISAMPGWKSAVGKRLDELIVDEIPDVQKAVRWNQPFYGTDGETWLLAFRCFTHYVQVNF